MNGNKEMNQQDKLKYQAAKKAIEYLPGSGVLGIGTGSTVNYFIDLLVPIKNRFNGVVSSSETSTKRLKANNIPILDLNMVGELEIYVDGADEANNQLHLIKGGGGALTREKIIASASKQFICIADESKLVHVMGQFPLPVEVIPIARSYVARQLIKLVGGHPILREDFISDNGNVILDIHNLEIMEPVKLESRINNIPGVVTAGLFAHRPADILIVGNTKGTPQIILSTTNNN